MDWFLDEIYIGVKWIEPAKKEFKLVFNLLSLKNKSSLENSILPFHKGRQMKPINYMKQSRM